MARAELLGVALPTAFDGGGMGVVELCLILQQIGRHAAPLPLLSTVMLGAGAIAEFGSDEQKRRWIPPVIGGDCQLAVALRDVGSRHPLHPATSAQPEAEGFVLNGGVSCVRGAGRAARVVVCARTDGGLGVFMVDPQQTGVSLETQRSTRGEALSLVTLADARIEHADVLCVGDRGAVAARWLHQHALLGICALKLGLAEKSLFMTAKYTTERKQFGKAIGTFQAVSQRAADAYIDVAAMRVTLWQAAWCLSEGRDAARALAIAKFWAADGGHRVAATAQHLHGGMGFDCDYPLHRYFLWGKQLEFSLGGANEHLAELGTMMARPD